MLDSRDESSARFAQQSYLILIHRRWYAVLDVPKDVQSELERSRFKKSLRTESKTIAERRKGPVIAEWQRKIDRSRALKDNPDAWLQERALHWRNDYLSADQDEKETLRSVLPEHIDDLKLKNETQEKAIYEVVTGESIPLSSKLEEWFSRLDNTPKTKDMKLSDGKRLAERLPYSTDVTRESVARWVEHLSHDEKLANGTIRRILSASRQYWSFLKRSGYVAFDYDPFYDAEPPRKQKTALDIENQREPFTIAEVFLLLSNTIEKRDQELINIVWLAMWTGCRIEEIGSLKKEHIQEDRIQIRAAKTPAGWRDIPIHPAIRPSIAQLSSTSSDEYLLKLSSNSKYRTRSAPVGKRFQTLKTNLGFGRTKVFHSIRKCVTTQLEQAGVPEGVSADILGHKKKTMTYGLYSGGTSMGARQQAIEEVDYDVPDLKFLITN